MTMGAGGNADAPDADVFAVVRVFLERIGRREPTKEELQELQPALEALYEKVMRIRRLSPSFRRVDLSDQVWSLLRRIGVKPRPATGGAFGRAASFL